MLGQTFQNEITPINIDSNVRVVMPETMYESFENSYNQSISQPYNRHGQNLQTISAFRPKNTYYRGYFDEASDVHPADVPMKSEISVIADVKMYYATPVAKAYRSLAAKAE